MGGEAKGLDFIMDVLIVSKGSSRMSKLVMELHYKSL